MIQKYFSAFDYEAMALERKALENLEDTAKKRLRIAVMQACNGHIKYACRFLGISERCLRDYIRLHPDFPTVKAEKEVNYDMLKSILSSIERIGA